MTVRLNKKHLEILEKLSDVLDVTKSDVIRYSLELLDVLLSNLGDGYENINDFDKLLHQLKTNGFKLAESVNKSVKKESEA